MPRSLICYFQSHLEIGFLFLFRFPYSFSQASLCMFYKPYTLLQVRCTTTEFSTYLCFTSVDAFCSLYNPYNWFYTAHKAAFLC